MSLPRLFGVLIIGLTLLAGGAISQDVKKDEKAQKEKKEGDKKEGDKKDKKEGDKKDKKDEKKDTLPPFFKGLNLTAEQKGKIAEVQKSFAPKVGELQKKIGELNKQVQELKKQEQSGVFGVLTDEQKKAYDAAVAASKVKKDEPKDKKKDEPKDKKKEPDKK